MPYCEYTDKVARFQRRRFIFRQSAGIAEPLRGPEERPAHREAHGVLGNPPWDRWILARARLTARRRRAMSIDPVAAWSFPCVDSAAGQPQQDEPSEPPQLGSEPVSAPIMMAAAHPTPAWTVMAPSG